MKKCKQCSQTKRPDEFYIRKGASTYNVCKDCIRLRVKNNYVANKAAHIERVRAWQARNQEKVKQYTNDWYENNRENHMFNVQLWKERNPEKARAHSMVAYAIKKGKLVRPDHCEVCGKREDMHGHHDDYSKPLEVRWLCVSCHRKHHEYYG